MIELVREFQVGYPNYRASPGSAWSITKHYGPALGAVLSDAKVTTGRMPRSGAAALAAVAGQLLEMLPWMVDFREGQASPVAS